MFGILVNGALHFLSTEIPEQNVPDQIVSFNLTDESYYSVPQPKLNGTSHWLTIGVLDGCLSLVDNCCSEDHHYSVWIMKEYGVQKSWSKLYRIEYPEHWFHTGTQGEQTPAALRPISFSKNRRELFFMVLFSHLVSYDSEKKTLHQVVHPNDQIVTWDMLIYEETLTSPLSASVSDDAEDVMGLSEDIMTNILLRLPVKYLLRFKSVSWSWYDLITDPFFITRHVEWSRKTSSKLHIVYNGPSFSLRHAEFDSFDQDTVLDHPFVGQHHSAVVVGVSEGLLCLCDTSTNNLIFPFALYNPTTRSSNVLPEPFFDVFSINYEHFFGFGYDATSDDYKIIKITQLQKQNDTSGDHAQVYSLNTNSWKRVTRMPFRLTGLLFTGATVNGIVHWVASSYFDERPCDEIAGFDLASENYYLIPQPPSLETILESRCIIDIGVLDGCLSQVRSYLDIHLHDVWIMREYRVQSSWSKVFRIVDEEPMPVMLKPKFFSRNKRELYLMAYSTFLVSYNVEEKKLRRCTYPKGVTWDVHVYEETLVPTDPGEGHE
ncbi:hypothetical protein RND81_05G187200 [Saponaria officinalis]